MLRKYIYNVELLKRDLAARGLQPTDLADLAGLSRPTVSRFLSGQVQTAKTARKVAQALGYTTPRRWVIEAVEAATV